MTPIIWIVGLLVWAYYSKDPARKRKRYIWAVVLLLFFSNSFIFDECSRLWEVPATSLAETDACQYGIVLGGMSVYDPEMNRAQFYRGVDRLLQAVELYRLKKIKKIIFTGGSGRILHPEMKEGNYINRYLLYMGIPREDFIIESESQNTRENATMTDSVVVHDQLKGPFLLITSGFHMRRSLGCFRKVGLEVKPYSTDRYAGPRKWEFDYLFIPNASAVNDWSTLIHEIVGYVTYRMMGYL